MQRLTARLALVFSLIVLLALGGVVLYAWGHIGQVMEGQVHVSLLERTRLLAAAGRPAFEPSASRALLLEEWSKAAGGRVSLFDTAGLPLPDVGTEPSGTPPSAVVPPEVAQAMTAGEAIVQRFSPPGPEPMVFAAVVVRDVQGRPLGVVRVGVPASAVPQAAGDLRWTLLGTAGIAAVLTILLALLAAWWLSRPFSRLARIAAEGPLEESIYAGGTWEARQLARGLNRMAEQAREMAATVSAEKNRLASILMSLNEALIATDDQGIIQLANPAAERLFGFQAQGAQGLPLIHVVRDYEVAQTLTKGIQEGRPVAAQVELVPDRRMVTIIVTPYQADGKWQAVLLARDLSDLQQTQRMRRDFVANVSHELRTPLAGIAATLDALDAGALEDRAVARQFLANVREEVNRMTRLVEELLELSGLEAGRAQFNVVPISVEEAVRKAATSLSPMAERQGVALRVECPSDLPLVLADQDRLHEVVVNLLHNAIKFSPPDRAVIVLAKAEESHIVVSVIDHGPGIAADRLPYIFERFYKGDPNRSQEGAGLGLSIARHIVELHGGHIWAESEEGQGATFTFTLPRADVARSKA
ncbi:MAG: PAS domain S-box protein [Chloroflexi bacterium]|nr:PAS domain S-box protein [Chloroflexota bacterium]